MWKWEFVCWFVKLISSSPEHCARRFRRLAERIAVETDKGNDWWGIFRSYPKRSKASSAWVCGNHRSPEHDTKTAVVIQGPVVARDDLTYETVKLYRTTMPQCELIVSTWDDTQREEQERIESLGAIVLRNEQPAHSGPFHLNYQVVSTANGLKEAKRLGCKYAMKTRCDTRIHLAGADQFLHDLLIQFPPADDLQQKRLVVLDFATRLYIPFHPSDMMMFGTIDDMIRYWAPVLCGRDQVFEPCDRFADMLEQSIPEKVLCERYLGTLGLDVIQTLDYWWKVLGERFVVVDREMIHHFWPKYHYGVNQRVEMDWDKTNMALCHFAQWMQMATRPPIAQVQMDELITGDVYDNIGSIGDHSNAA